MSGQHARFIVFVGHKVRGELQDPPFLLQPCFILIFSAISCMLSAVLDFFYFSLQSTLFQ